MTSKARFQGHNIIQREELGIFDTIRSTGSIVVAVIGPNVGSLTTTIKIIVM